MLSLFLLQVLGPYLVEKVKEFISRRNWANPENNRSGASKTKKLKYILAKLFQYLVQIGKVAELINFLGFMSQQDGKAKLFNFRRNVVETIL